MADSDYPVVKVIKRKMPNISFNRPRMERALKSGKVTEIPPGLSREELRKLIINSINK